jgi:cytochrome c oxidase subunit 3
VNPIKALLEKPWLVDSRPAEVIHSGSAARMATLRSGLWLFLAVVTALFLLLSSAYFGRMSMPDWTPMQEPRLLWLNTGLLVLSSFAMQWAATSAHRERMAGVRAGLLTGGVLAVAFLAGQILAWQQLAALGFYATANPAYAFFYVITTLHGLHILGGLVVLGVAADHAWRSDDAAAMRRAARLCAIYWHFLLVVWAALFAFMLADNSGPLHIINIVSHHASQLFEADLSRY